MSSRLLFAMLLGIACAGRPAVAADANNDAKSDKDIWSVHGQTTFITQGYPAMRSPYQGANSLPGKGQVRETWTATAFIGRELSQSTEVYFNPEMAQGFGLASTVGLAGFSNGEAQKAGATFPRLRAQRYFVRQTFGFGGEQETVEDGPNQFAGKRDIDRITLTVGRFAIGDFFDANSYAHDPRADFLNWSMWSSAAYDFPADLPGFTRGAVAELNRKDWTLRAGLFQVPDAPNSDVLKFDAGGAAVEFEDRYTLLGKAGKFRVGAFLNRGQTANYRDAIAAAAADPSLDINAAVLAMRRTRSKEGFYVNVEQAIGRDTGLFGRASWNDGKNEILSFTDIDRSVSGGISVKGRDWGRPDDTLGFGGAINGLSSAHRDFLAAGGLGLLIGDGALNYRTETPDRGLLRDRPDAACDPELRLPVYCQSGLQCGPGPGFHLRHPPPHRILNGNQPNRRGFLSSQRFALSQSVRHILASNNTANRHFRGKRAAADRRVGVAHARTTLSPLAGGDCRRCVAGGRGGGHRAATASSGRAASQRYVESIPARQRALSSDRRRVGQPDG